MRISSRFPTPNGAARAFFNKLLSAGANGLRRRVMSAIEVERAVAPERLAALKVSTWPVWSKGVSEFPWRYDEQETCFLLDGEVEVRAEGGQVVTFGKGDLVTFPEGLACTWKVIRPVRKHYRFG
jgi:uncharacterized cupin superfamily protein